MPIRLRDSNAFVGRVRATLDSASASVSGTHVAPPSRAGAIAVQLGEMAGAIVGQFQAAPNRLGTIATTLAGVTSNEQGTSLPPPIPNVTGTIAAAIGVTAAVQGTSAPPNQPATWWPNWPIPNVACLQGSSTTTILDSTRWAELADKDLIIGQGNYPTSSRNSAIISALTSIRALRPSHRVRFVPHVMAQETTKVQASPPNNGELEIAWNIINSPTRGRESWYVHRVGNTTSTGRVESNNQPSLKNECNMACLVSGLNSLGRNYAYEFWQEWDTLWGNASADIRPHLDGAFQDNFNQRPPDMFINNGATLITDHDFDGNGTIDSRTDFTLNGANAGGDKWAAGHMEFYAQWRLRNPTKTLVPNRARAGSDYTDSAGDPPLPMSGSRFYRQFEITFAEHMNLKLGLDDGASSYAFNGGGSAILFFRSYELGERELMPDAQNTLTGKSAVLIHANCVNRATPTQDDYTYARFISALALLVERGAPCVQQSPALPLSLDETLLELGAPAITRTMGTLNENTGAFPSLRTADFSSGVARFYWAVFAKGIVVARTDAPTVGVYPSADAAVSCPLPIPPTGKKWQRINASNYVNPITGRSMRNQSPTINNGADSPSISLKPYHAMFLRLVNA